MLKLVCMDLFFSAKVELFVPKGYAQRGIWTHDHWIKSPALYHAELAGRSSNDKHTVHILIKGFNIFMYVVKKPTTKGSDQPESNQWPFDDQ